MMLYFITKKQNLNNIFSSESISPPSFYDNKNIGVDEYYCSSYDLNTDFITMYKVIPNNITLTDYVIFEIKLNWNFHKFIEVNNSVYFFSTTIYLNNENFKIFFQNEEDYNKCIVLSSIISEVKNINKYKSNIRFESNLNTLESNKLDISSHCKDYINRSKSIEKSKNILLDKIRGAYFMAAFKNRGVFIKNKKGFEQRLQEINLLKIKKLVESQSMYYKNVRLGISKELKEIRQKYKKHKTNYTILFPVSMNNIKINFPYVLKLNNSFEKRILEISLNLILKEGDSSYIIDKLLDEVNNLRDDEIKFKYLEDVDIMKQLILHGSINVYISSISSDVIKNICICLLKKNNLDEVEKIIKGNNVENSIICYIMLGMLKGYTHVNKICVSSVQNNITLYNELTEEIDLIQKRIENIHKINLYEKILKLRVKNTLHKFVMRNMDKKFQVKSIKFNKHKLSTKIFIETLHNNYVIILYNYETKDFLKEINSFKIVNKRPNEEYKSFKCGKYVDNKIKDLDLHEYEDLNLVVGDILKKL